MLNEEVKTQIKGQFQELDKQITLEVFTQEIECQYCQDTRSLAEEVAALSDRITVHVYDFKKDSKQVEQYGIDKIPAIAVVGEKDFGIRFFGIPGGYEFSSFLEAIKLVSRGHPEISDETKSFLDSVTSEVHLQVFVTPTCPYCPRAVMLAHYFAYYSEKIKGDMIEVSEFPHLGNRYNVMGVPRTVINETEFQEGSAPEEMLVEKIKNVIN
jgi:glutaredoxin-like protein